MLLITEQGATFKTRKQIKADYPDAVMIVRVEGGYAVFFSKAEFETWKKQQ